MKKFIGNTAVKILAVVLSFIVFFSMLISVVGSSIMLFNDFYTRDFKTLEENIMKNLARQEMYNIVNMYSNGEKSIESYYDDKNILYNIENFHGGLNISNYNGQDYIASYSSSELITRYVNKFDGTVYDANAVEYDVDGDFYYHYATNIEVYETSHKVEFTIYIPRDMQFTDRFFLVDKLINIGYGNRYTFIFTAIFSLILCIVVYSYLFISVGHKKDSSEVCVALINKVPADVATVVTLIIYFLGFWLFTQLKTLVVIIAISFVIILTLYFVALWYLLTITVQIKASKFLKNTFLYWFFNVLIKLGRVIKHIYKNFTTVYKVAMVIGAFLAFELIFMGVNVYENDNLIIGWIIISVIASIVLLLAAIAFQRVKQGGERIVNGDLENKIDTQYMFGDIKDFAESLNNINQGLQTAIDDKMKSERFKTELITNVSHDIKTPLTSIVNYVDLIKKEECNNKKINEYIEVLDRQSIRLKKLIEDLVEASKAQTGNLSVELSKCNLSILINQAIAEFSERLESKNLQVVTSLPQEDIFILADGRRLWRVFDNLLNNICKYTLKGTRVYVNLNCENEMAIITLKNISDQPINISGDELTERFVRGDRSRNTEGSGLGLSIAKSLTELQNGKFIIETDGDLFKAKIIFNIIK